MCGKEEGGWGLYVVVRVLRDRVSVREIGMGSEKGSLLNACTR